MSGDLPSVWESERWPLLAIWLIFAAAHMSLLWRSGEPVSALFEPRWLSRARVFALGVAGISLWMLQGSWRIQRAMARFAREVPGERRGYVSGMEMVLAWEDVPLELRGMSVFGYAGDLTARLESEEWTFEPWAAPLVAREVLTRLEGPDQVRDSRARRVPWGLLHPLTLVGPLFVGLAAGVYTYLAFSWRPAFLVGVAATILAYAFLLWGRVRARKLVAQVVEGLRNAGLQVDGPYLAAALLAPRYVVFTRKGPVSMQVPAFGPVVKLLVWWQEGPVRRVGPDGAAQVAADIAASLQGERAR